MTDIHRSVLLKPIATELENNKVTLKLIILYNLSKFQH